MQERRAIAAAHLGEVEIMDVADLELRQRQAHGEAVGGRLRFEHARLGLVDLHLS